MTTELDYNYTPAASLDESNDDVAKILAIARRIVCQAAAHTDTSALPERRRCLLADLDSLLDRAQQSHVLLEVIDLELA